MILKLYTEQQLFHTYGHLIPKGIEHNAKHLMEIMKYSGIIVKKCNDRYVISE